MERAQTRVGQWNDEWPTASLDRFAWLLIAGPGSVKVATRQYAAPFV